MLKFSAIILWEVFFEKNKLIDKKRWLNYNKFSHLLSYRKQCFVISFPVLEVILFWTA